MGGLSYELSSLNVLKFICSSYIRGEAQYYSKDSDSSLKSNKRMEITNTLFSTNDASYKILDDAIDAALDDDFGKVLDYAVDLRHTHLMRLNPQVILVKAVLHPKRVEFNKLHPEKMRKIIFNVIGRPDDMYNQLKIYIELTGSKANLPGILKRSWANRLEATSRYQLKKYLNQGHIIDLIRLSHPNPKKNSILTEIVLTGNLQIDDTEQTWEMMKSSGKTWKEICSSDFGIPHMALLRNLRGILTEFTNITPSVDYKIILNKVMNDLINGVPGGKQFPFRYYVAYKEINKLPPHSYKTNVLNGLGKCLHKSMENFPQLDGDVVSLADNSYSAHGTFMSKYGVVTVSDIANMSALITAYNCTGNGYVGIFGDNLYMYHVKKTVPLLSQMDKIRTIGKGIGEQSEHGIWVFFKHAFQNDIKYRFDHIFVYSDMQAGHGNLYGNNPEDYKDYSISGPGCFMDVMKLVQKYRNSVNKKASFFSVQVAGYNNNILPENIYRGAIMSGWTGKEVPLAAELLKLWDECEHVI